MAIGGVKSKAKPDGAIEKDAYVRLVFLDTSNGIPTAKIVISRVMAKALADGIYGSMVGIEKELKSKEISKAGNPGEIGVQGYGKSYQ